MNISRTMTSRNSLIFPFIGSTDDASGDGKSLDRNDYYIDFFQHDSDVSWCHSFWENLIVTGISDFHEKGLIGQKVWKLHVTYLVNNNRHYVLRKANKIIPFYFNQPDET